MFPLRLWVEAFLVSYLLLGAAFNPLCSSVAAASVQSLPPLSDGCLHLTFPLWVSVSNSPFLNRDTIKKRHQSSWIRTHLNNFILTRASAKTLFPNTVTSQVLGVRTATSLLGDTIHTFPHIMLSSHYHYSFFFSCFLPSVPPPSLPPFSSLPPSLYLQQIFIESLLCPHPSDYHHTHI